MEKRVCQSQTSVRHSTDAPSPTGMIIARTVEVIAPLLLLSTFAILFTFPVIDPDLFWHLNTGEYIATTKSLPETDPFSYTASQVPHDPVTLTGVLKGYWLSQVFLYLIWKYLGITGIIGIRSVVYTMILLIVYMWTRKRSNIVIAAGLTLLVGSDLLLVGNERPQLFSFLFMLAALYLAETIRSSKHLPLHSWFLPVIMILWSNMHRAYILGVIILAIYLAEHIVTHRTAASSRTILLITLSMAATLLNPTGINGLIGGLGHAAPAFINEYLSPYDAFTKYHIVRPSYYVCLLVSLAAMVAALRKRELAHAAVLITLMSLSFQALRHIPYLFLAVPLAAPYLLLIPKRAAVAIVLAGFLFWGKNVSFANTLQFRPENTFPELAAMAVNDVNPEGRMFNYYDWGGYLMFHAPSYPVFIDSRGFSQELNTIHGNVIMGIGWKEVFSRHNINFAVIPWRDRFTNLPMPLAVRLAAEEDWDLLYFGEVDAVFLRKTGKNRRIIDQYGSKKALFRKLIGRTAAHPL